jgi:hypothetical protein
MAIADAPHPITASTGDAGMSWLPLDGQLVSSDPAACWFADGLHVFALDSHHTMIHKRRGGRWSEWQLLGEHVAFEHGPVACQALGRLHVFAVGLDNATYQNSTSDGWAWSGWRSLGGWVEPAPAVVGSPGCIDVFGRGFDNAVWHIFSTGAEDCSSRDSLEGAIPDGHPAKVKAPGWSDWYSLGGVVSSNPVAAACGGSPRLLELFVRGTDRALWHARHDGSAWTSWEWWGGSPCSQPAAASWGGLRVDVVARGPGNHLWHKAYDGRGKRFYEELVETEELLSKPTLLARGPGNLWVLARGLDATVRCARSSPEGLFERWVALPGGPFRGDPVVALDAPRDDGLTDLFARGFDSILYHTQLKAEDGGTLG